MLKHINYAVKKGEKTGSITILPCRHHEINIGVLYKHVCDSIIIHHRILRLRISLFLDELGEEALGLDGGDVATVVAPHQNTTLYVQ
uniref:Uncharacterized protein n=1 Tax=Rhizophora mucronata TaxID=61149 RepID=A0A2P2K8P6_RHIMU